MRLFATPLALAACLKARVREVTQLTVSCGIASNKLVAKIACLLSKRDGQGSTFYFTCRVQRRRLRRIRSEIAEAGVSSAAKWSRLERP